MLEKLKQDVCIHVYTNTVLYIYHLSESERERIKHQIEYDWLREQFRQEQVDELLEKLEQLRLLENGIPMRVVVTSFRTCGVDTPEDLEAVRAVLARQPG